MHCRFLDTNGDGTGIKNAAVNGSVTPQIFKYRPEIDESLGVYRMVISIVDFGSFDSGKYGNSIIMNNGIKFGLYRAVDDELLIDFLDGQPVKKNIDWSHYCHEFMLSSYGQGDASLHGYWPFSDDGYALILTNREYIAVTINDDLTDLSEHYFNIQCKELE